MFKHSQRTLGKSNSKAALIKTHFKMIKEDYILLAQQILLQDLSFQMLVQHQILRAFVIFVAKDL